MFLYYVSFLFPEVESQMHNPIDQPREGAAYLSGKGADPLLH